MLNNKTFRLFISSTFNDFKREREILQTKVFPKIKEYASTNGFVFQPIDLRWGVSNEVQLNQKTLELCLNEVKACKTYMHPNFLIMVGDRYGWVPLPYAIESNEFHKILLHVEENDQKLLKAWYKKDLNHLPTSYILHERVDQYKDFNIWNNIETAIRDILQKAVIASNLDEDQKRKYFLSATEAEVEEGIIPYIKPTKFQAEKLLKRNSDLSIVDIKHIFGFLRDVDETTQIEEKFIETSNKKAIEFKQRVKETLIEENTLHIKTKQIDRETLDEKYLEEFEIRILKFLKSQIDERKLQIDKTKYTPLNLELSAQDYFAKKKRKNFIGQEELIKTIITYSMNEDTKPLIIYGESGKGKSALIAKAIKEVEKISNAKIIFRFIGATPNSTSSKEVLTSILNELQIDIQNKNEKESFEEFSYKVLAQLQNIKEDVIIFIDAVDQLQNDDQFLWLPEILPSNIKIILSALKDINYKKDTEYFQTLQTKTTNLYKISAFREPEKLLNILLKEENRTIDKFQKKYFLEQYKQVQSPLYIIIAAQEMKNWKSGDRNKTLSNTQNGIIKEFIHNLTEFYHHDKEFVHKVLGYIYPSKHGLSESELLQLLAQDEEFIKKMAPDTWHENPNKELPLVHWSRLQTQLKPFLSVKTQDNEELIYFFHREFEDVVKEQENQREEHESIIKATQKLILKNQDKSFNANRWGKLYAKVVIEYILINSTDFKKILNFIYSELNEEWLQDFYQYLLIESSIYNKYQNIKYACLYTKLNKFLLEKNYTQDTTQWEMYTMTLRDLSNLQCDDINSEELLKRSLSLVKEKYQQDPNTSTDAYIDSLHSLAVYYDKENKIIKALELAEEASIILEELFEKDSSIWIDRYASTLMILAALYEKNHFIEQSITIVDFLIDIFEDKYQYIQDLNKNYIEILNFKLFLLNNHPKQLQNKRNLNRWISTLYNLVKILYRENPQYMRNHYIAILEEIAAVYYSQRKWEKAKYYVLEWKNLYLSTSDIQKNKIMELNNILEYLDNKLLEEMK